MSRVSSHSPVLPADQAREILAHVGEAAALLRSLANEQRLLILCQLVQGERSVGELGEAVALSQSALSQHLAVLRDSGIVATRRQGQRVFYALMPGPAGQVLETLHAIYCAGDHG